MHARAPAALVLVVVFSIFLSRAQPPKPSVNRTRRRCCCYCRRRVAVENQPLFMSPLPSNVIYAISINL